jgi:hypothetical protein
MVQRVIEPLMIFFVIEVFFFFFNFGKFVDVQFIILLEVGFNEGDFHTF